VAQLHPRALGSLYVISYDSQGYGAGTLTLPYLERQVGVVKFRHDKYDTDIIIKDAVNNTSIVGRIICRGNVFSNQLISGRIRIETWTEVRDL
jgi:hypothetical protein